MKRECEDSCNDRVLQVFPDHVTREDLIESLWTATRYANGKRANDERDAPYGTTAMPHGPEAEQRIDALADKRRSRDLATLGHIVLALAAVAGYLLTVKRFYVPPPESRFVVTVKKVAKGKPFLAVIRVDQFGRNRMATRLEIDLVTGAMTGLTRVSTSQLVVGWCSRVGVVILDRTGHKVLWRSKMWARGCDSLLVARLVPASVGNDRLLVLNTSIPKDVLARPGCRLVVVHEHLPNPLFLRRARETFAKLQGASGPAFTK